MYTTVTRNGLNLVSAFPCCAVLGQKLKQGHLQDLPARSSFTKGFCCFLIYAILTRWLLLAQPAASHPQCIRRDVHLKIGTGGMAIKPLGITSPGHQ